MNKNKEKNTMGKDFLLFVRDITVSMVVLFVLFHYVVRPVQVVGSSMYPTLKDQEFGISNVFSVKTGDLERFDIVIIYLEEKDEYLVKRIIGMPGETVSYTDGQLYINGEAVEEDFLDASYVSTYEDGTFMSDVAEVTLGEDEYYCLGDNRPHSTDSRYYGAFKSDQIVAKGVFVIWPLSEFGGTSS